jgi:hypothetical protein
MFAVEEGPFSLVSMDLSAGRTAAALSFALLLTVRSDVVSSLSFCRKRFDQRQERDCSLRFCSVLILNSLF